jgi:nickel-dependent lactate racemase
LIVVPDPTRYAAADRFLPLLVERIRSAGCRKVTFAVASGLHRRPSDEEVAAILGDGLAGSHPVILHDPDDQNALVELGRTSAGTRVEVHGGLLEHDRLVLTGAVGFHYYAGFSGGRKSVVPGMASRETIVRNHLRAVRRDGTRHPLARAGRLDGNPVHRDMAEGAAMLEPSYLVNTVLGPGGGIERIFAGHWRRAHVAACRYLRKTRSVRVEPRDLVVVSAGGHPSDIDLIQSHKAFEATIGALNTGGVLVLVAECADGAGHADFLPAFREPTVDDLLRLLMREYRVYRQTALAWRRKLEHCRLVLVSGLDDSTVRQLGAEPARTLEEAFAIARRHLPEGAAGWFFPQGTKWLIVPEEK